MKLIMENWRQYVNEQEEQAAKPSAKDAEVEKLAAALREQFQLVKQLKQEMANAPEKLEDKNQLAKLNNIWNKIVQPYLDEGDKITDQSGQIDDPAELRTFLKTVYRPYIKKSKPIMMHFYKTAKASKLPITKQHYSIILIGAETDLKHAQTMFKLAKSGDSADVNTIMDKINQEREAAEAKRKETEARIEKLKALADSNTQVGSAFNFIKSTIAKNFGAAMGRNDMAAAQKIKTFFQSVIDAHDQQNYEQIFKLAKAGGWKGQQPQQAK